MIRFLNEDIRTRFHCLPLEKQQDWETVAAAYEHKGFQLTVTFVEAEGTTLEVSVRIDKEFNSRSVIDDPA